MNSLLLRLNSRDFQKGAVVAVLGAVLGVLNQALQSGFDPFTYDWLSVLKVAGSAFLAYLLKNFLSDENGKVLGMIG